MSARPLAVSPLFHRARERRRPRRCRSALAGAIATLVPLATPARAEAGPTVAILHEFTAAEELVRELRTAASRAVHLMGGDTLPHAFVERQLQGCRDDRCRIEVARLGGAEFVVFLTGQHAQQSFDLTTRVWETDTGRELGQRSKSCELCSVKELLNAAEDQVAVLLASTGPAGGARASSPHDGGQDEGASAQAPLWGWALAGLGAALTATGVVHWLQDGRCTDERPLAGGGTQCLRRAERPAGPWLTAGGLVLVAGGVLVVTGTF